MSLISLCREMPTPFELFLLLESQIFSTPNAISASNNPFLTQIIWKSLRILIISSSFWLSSNIECILSSALSRQQVVSSCNRPSMSMKQVSSSPIRSVQITPLISEFLFKSCICTLNFSMPTSAGSSQKSNFLMSFLSPPRNASLVQQSINSLRYRARSKVMGCRFASPYLINMRCSPAFEVSRSLL